MRGGRLQNFLKHKKATLAMSAMIAMAMVTLIAGGVIDYASLRMQQADVQHAADAAALAAAHELALAADADQRVGPVAQTFVEANYSRAFKADAKIVEDGKAVQVTVTSPPRVFFPGPIGMNAKVVTAEAVAELMGETANICVVTLDENSGRALSLEENASLDARNCAIYSNSTDKKGLSAIGASTIKGKLICTAGGKEGGAGNFDPEPVLDCPQLADPLAERPMPAVGSCTFNKVDKKDYVGHLSPGVYCGGVRLNGASNVVFDPGVYVIKDGDFRVGDTSKITGNGVGFFITGANARFEFTKNAHVHLSAPKTGPMAGLLFMEDRNLDKLTKHRITSDFADYLVGTIYLPRGSFLIDATQDVADESEFTVLVVRELELKDGPRLVLNTNYASSAVPVPEGVGNKGEKGARLVR
ncbi:MAG TPA: pilus assembly protein TadG-related protein [Hyphomonadaceae bacterium]|nr:pilus assembly protein TadG-related protein [Hyphomonadaceae bacterium]